MIEIKCFITDKKYRTNTYVIICQNRNEAAVIDPSDHCQQLIQYIEAHSIQIKYIINTHSHPDHCAGNHILYQKFNPLLLISPKEEKLLKSLIHAGFISKQPVPYHFIGGGDVVEIGTEKIEVVETPGHTEGSISLVAGNNVFVGDFFLSGSDKMPQAIYERFMQNGFKPNQPIVLYPGHAAPIILNEDFRRIDTLEI
jgi:hydroxyacylglutathione hydrolase